MSKPNRAMAHLSKNPWTEVMANRNYAATVTKEQELVAAGKKVRRTTRKLGSRRLGTLHTIYVLWTTE